MDVIVSSAVRLEDDPIWKALTKHGRQLKADSMQDWFAQDAHRTERFTRRACGLSVDFSKNRITSKSFDLLMALAQKRGVVEKIESLFKGELVNDTEKRPALHMAFRAPKFDGFSLAAHFQKSVQMQQSAVNRWLDKVEAEGLLGSTNQPIKHIINIGIGGSDLGPKLVVEALSPPQKMDREMHFLSTIDPSAIETLQAKCNPSQTLLIISSKSFSTSETLLNASTLIKWLKANKLDMKSHCYAVTANRSAAEKFGIDVENIFEMPEWVGGRYSVWSAIGLPIALALGKDAFDKLKAGAFAMDQHFRQAELRDNIPVIMALLDIWYRQVFKTQTHAIIPYAQALSSLPRFLQQLEMESLGKSWTKHHRFATYPTGGIVWGESGPNMQHAFAQLLHQGSDLIPADFIVPIDSNTTLDERHQHQLIAGALSQSLTLMTGRANKEGAKQLSGNRPSTLIFLPKLDPYSLGALLALYEHKVFVQAAIWDINPFDQFGVEWSKIIAKEMATILQTGQSNSHMDDATKALLAEVARIKEQING